MKVSSGFNILSTEETPKKLSAKFGKSKYHQAQFLVTLKAVGMQLY